MPDPNPDQMVQQMRQYVEAVQQLIEQYEAEQQPPPQPESAETRAHRMWGMPLAVLVGVALWLRERYAASVAAAGAATVMVAVAWLVGQGPTDEPDAAPTATVTRPPSASPTLPSTTPETATSSVPPSDQAASTPQAPADVAEEPAADEPAPPTDPPVVDDEPPDVTPPPGDVGGGVEDVARQPRRCLTARVGDLRVRVCRR